MKISVITATYNSAATVRDTFESILSQTFQDYEYIVIDGNSKDETVSIIKEYSAKFDGRMRWISEPDKGIYDAMNKGISMATGGVIGILNSDDFYTSNDVLEAVDNEFMYGGVDAVYGDVHYVDNENLKKCVRYYSSKSFRRWKMRFGYMPAHPSFYCKREIYEKFGKFDTLLKIASDFECLLRFIFAGKIRTKYIEKDFVTMRTGGASSSGIVSHKQILKDHLKAYKKNNVFSNIFFESFRYVGKLINLYYQKIIRLIIERLVKITSSLIKCYHINDINIEKI
jgi:glycosyltransferase involved in cell wall biosynthesis